MNFYQEYKTQRAHEFINECEANGLKFGFENNELIVTFTEASCANIRMKEFSLNLRWMSEEISEILMRRKKGGHLKLVAFNGTAL